MLHRTTGQDTGVVPRSPRADPGRKNGAAGETGNSCADDDDVVTAGDRAAQPVGAGPLLPPRRLELAGRVQLGLQQMRVIPGSQARDSQCRVKIENVDGLEDNHGAVAHRACESDLNRGRTIGMKNPRWLIVMPRKRT